MTFRVSALGAARWRSPRRMQLICPIDAQIDQTSASLLVTSALLVASALLVVTMFAIRIKLTRIVLQSISSMNSVLEFYFLYRLPVESFQSTSFV